MKIFNISFTVILFLIQSNRILGHIIDKYCDERNKIPMPGDNKKFYECINGTYKLFNCPEKEYETNFDINHQDCIPSQYANSFTQSYSVDLYLKRECQVNDKREVIGACEKYEECLTNVIGSAYGKWFLLRCNDSFHFDPQLKTCISSEKSNCSQSQLEIKKDMKFGYLAKVSSIAILKTGMMVNGLYDKTIRIRNPITGKILKTFYGHTDVVECLTVLSNDQIVSGSKDKTIKIWDPINGKCLKTLSGHTDVVECLTVLSNDQIVSGSRDKTIKIWDPINGKCLKTFSAHDGWIRNLVILKSGKIVSASNDKTIKIWDPHYEVCLRTLTDHESEVYSLTVLSDDKIVSGHRNKVIKIWNPITGKCLKTLHGHESWIRSLVALNDEKIISGSNDVRIWDSNTGKNFKVLSISGFIYTLAVMNSSKIISGSGDGTINIWNTK